MLELIELARKQKCPFPPNVFEIYLKMYGFNVDVQAV
jgi:hypothetical protein